MCIETTSTYLQCLHSHRHFTRCQDSYEPRTQKKQGFFKSLFSSSAASKTSKSCRTTQGRSTIQGFCSNCLGRAAAERQETIHRMEQPRYVQSSRFETQNPTEQERRRSHGKGTFRCSRCTIEGRHPSARIRQANGGVCCDRGSIEWKGPRGQAHRTVTPFISRRPVPPQAKPALKRVPQNHHLRRQDSTQAARAQASAAAKRYNWTRNDRESAELNPSLVRDYVTLSGADHSRIPAAPRPVAAPRRQAEPLYEDPGIDLTRWAAAPQTNHGRLPPPPDNPLPVRPLRPGRRGQSPPRIRTPTPGRRLTPEPLRPQPKDMAQVSPETSPTTYSTSPVSPLNNS